MLFYIILAAVAALVGAFPICVLHYRFLKNRIEPLKRQIDESWKAGFDAGWKAASEDYTNVKMNYDRIFNPNQN